jgi:hypothetical protein
MRAELALMAGALALGTGVAEVAGASNLGTALTFGVIAFAATVVWIIAKRPG